MLADIAIMACGTVHGVIGSWCPPCLLACLQPRSHTKSIRVVPSIHDCLSSLCQGCTCAQQLLHGCNGSDLGKRICIKMKRGRTARKIGRTLCWLLLMRTCLYVQGYRVGSSQLQFEITAHISVEQPPSNSTSSSSIPEPERNRPRFPNEKLRLSPSVPLAVSDSRLASMRLLGDLATYQQTTVLRFVEAHVLYSTLPDPVGTC